MRDSKSDTVFIVGIEIRPGRGKYRSTNIITISPRYQLHNRSAYNLLFAQLYCVKSLDHNSQKRCLKALSNSYMPFHWSNLEQDQLLCVSINDIPDCCWSGGLKIDANSSMHVNVRQVIQFLVNVQDCLYFFHGTMSYNKCTGYHKLSIF